jgi:hypothetical protein
MKLRTPRSVVGIVGIAIFAILANTFAPALAAALRPTAAGAICSAGGVQRQPVGDLGSGPHCPYCAPHAAQFCAPPPAAAHVVAPAAVHAVARSAGQTVAACLPRPAAQPRAPPLLG